MTGPVIFWVVCSNIDDQHTDILYMWFMKQCSFMLFPFQFYAPLVEVESQTSGIYKSNITQFVAQGCRNRLRKLLSSCRGVISGREGCLGSERVFDNRECWLCMLVYKWLWLRSRSAQLIWPKQLLCTFLMSAFKYFHVSLHFRQAWVSPTLVCWMVMMSI